MLFERQHKGAHKLTLKPVPAAMAKQNCSNCMDEAHVWLRTDDNEGHGYSVLLSREDAANLAVILQYFAETGTVPEEVEF